MAATFGRPCMSLYFNCTLSTMPALPALLTSILWPRHAMRYPITKDRSWVAGATSTGLGDGGIQLVPDSVPPPYDHSPSHMPGAYPHATTGVLDGGASNQSWLDMETSHENRPLTQGKGGSRPWPSPLWQHTPHVDAPRSTPKGWSRAVTTASVPLAPLTGAIDL